MNPHELLEAYVIERLGRQVAPYAAVQDSLLRPLILGLTDQFSIYTDCRPYARLKVHDVRLKEGRTRSYILMRVSADNAPLRMHPTMLGFHMRKGDRIDEFVQDVNGRRWRFLDRWMTRFLEPLFRGIASALVSYYLRHPNATPQVGLFRLCESVDATYLVIEIDEHESEKPGKPEGATRYNVD